MSHVVTRSRSDLNPRRSSRLNKTPGAHVQAYVQITEKPKAKRRRASEKPRIPEVVLEPVARNLKRRRLSSSSVQPKDLDKREKELLRREKEVELQKDELESQQANLNQKEKEADSVIETRIAQSTLRQLEEHYLCALCYEIMACPYSLSPAKCGHSFCAICILKWYFSRLHRVCGAWHEAVDCPVCRNVLAVAPDRIPRSEISIPFTPNRPADSFVKDALDKIALTALEPKTAEKKSKGRKSIPADPLAQTNPLIGWRIGGQLKMDWTSREREGRQEMQNLVRRWQTLHAGDFIEIKNRLGV